MLSKSFLSLFKTKRKYFNFCGMLIFLSACQYHLVNPKEQQKIEISFKGERATPTFKNELMFAMKRLTSSRVVSSHGRYEVIVDVNKLRHDNIGFLYDEEPLSGALIDRLFPNEGRLTLEASITIVDKDQLSSMIRKKSLSASSEYDFTNPNTLRDTQYGGVPFVEYSLGQFDAEDGAYDVALPLVEKNLAEQVALFIGGVCPTR